MYLKSIFTFISFFYISFSYSQTSIKDIETNHPVSYATVSFGDGQGLFADDEGTFFFTKKLYPDIDSLYISALGYKDMALSTNSLPKTIHLKIEHDVLDEVLIHAKIDRKFKEATIKPYLDDDYYKCWLPTIESEIAVFFKTETPKLKQLSEIHFPIALESKNWGKRKRANADKQPFSTLFKVNIYKNESGYPGEIINTSNIVFRATEKHGDVYNLDISEHNIFIPENGFFVSLQVLGYTDKVGKLLPNKKYKEITNGNRTVKIPTNFRPLLPFTDQISQNNTFIKRVFLQRNSWVKFEKGSSISSTLLKTGLNNYGVGITYKIYKDE